MSIAELPTSMKPTLALVTHLPLQASGGGVFAVSWQIAAQLRRHFPVATPAPVSTPIDRPARLVSRIQRRLLRRPGTFFTFSEWVLKKMAAGVSVAVPPTADAVFFRSATRWIRWKPDRPYFVHTDACFHTFFHNTFQPRDFHASDLQRIWDTEAQFLDQAAGVFFESRWGLRKAIEAYRISGRNFVASRIAGAIAPPETDSRLSDGRFRLITIAKHFRQKGGDLVAAAYARLKSNYPQLAWTIVGGPPDEATLMLPDVQYAGFLHPDKPDELEQFRSLLSAADLLMHPTREDTNPLVLLEAASFGCPCITVNSFAIPELVVDGITGLLLDQPASADSLTEALQSLLGAPERVKMLRLAARDRALKQFSWNTIGNELATEILQRMDGSR